MHSYDPSFVSTGLINRLKGAIEQRFKKELTDHVQESSLTAPSISEKSSSSRSMKGSKLSKSLYMSQESITCSSYCGQPE